MPANHTHVLQVPGWDRLQEDRPRVRGGEIRRLPWWKIYHEEIVDKVEFRTLTKAQRADWLDLQALARRTHNAIPDDQTWLRWQLRSQEDLDIAALIDAGLIVRTPVRAEDGQASGQVSEPAGQVSAPEEKREEKKGEEKRVERRADAPPSLSIADLVADGLDEALAKDFLAYRRKKKADLTVRAWSGFRSEVAKAGWTVAAAVEKTITRNWISFEAAWVADDKGGPQKRPGVHIGPQDFSAPWK